MTESDVIICWNHGGFPKGLESAFQRPTRVISLANPVSWAHAVDKYWPFPVRGIIKEFAPDVTPLRVAALGFSASCQGVSQLLSSQDGAALDAVIAIDGIHTGYVQTGGQKTVNPNGMKPWFDYGKYAVVNERLFVISHSSVVPPNYASTTQTAEWLWNTLTMEPTAFTVPPLPVLNVPPTSVHVAAGPSTGKDRTIQYPAPPWKGKRRCGGLVVLGCSNLDGPGTADHIYQAKAMLPLMLQAFLAERWNTIDPKALGQVCFVHGPESPFGWLPGLGSAIDVKAAVKKCAGSMVLPANFVSSKTPEKLPTSTPPIAAGTVATTKSSGNYSLLTATLFVAAGTAGLWWLSSRQALGLRANPETRTWFVRWFFDSVEHTSRHKSLDSALRFAIALRDGSTPVKNGYVFVEHGHPRLVDALWRFNVSWGLRSSSDEASAWAAKHPKLWHPKTRAGGATGPALPPGFEGFE